MSRNFTMYAFFLPPNTRGEKAIGYCLDRTQARCVEIERSKTLQENLLLYKWFGVSVIGKKRCIKAVLGQNNIGWMKQK